ncbi:MAG: hypothetical protein ABJF23_00415 [Bryobacteraceae bacterium]
MGYLPFRSICIPAVLLICACSAESQTQPEPVADPNPNRTTGFAVDAKGDSFIAIAGQNKVYKLNSAGELSLYAGTGEAGFNGDDVAATQAQLNAPWGLFLDSSGNLYIADTGNARLRKVDAGTGAITTVAGNGTSGSDGDGAVATSAQLNTPLGFTADETGNLVIAEAKSARVRTIAADSGLIATVPLDDGMDPLAAPYGIVKDEAGVVFAADSGRIFKIDAGKLKKTLPETVFLTQSGIFFAPSLKQISYPPVSSSVPLADAVEWVPAYCPPPGTNPGPEECAASARLQVDLRRPPAKSTLEVKAFGNPDMVATWKVKDLQFETVTGTGTVAPVKLDLPLELSTRSGPVSIDVDIPLSAVRVKMLVTGTVLINSSEFYFSLGGYLFP